MLHTVLGRWRTTEAMLRQSEKMAQLGTLTAGVAHELNNPAAAVRRGASQLQETIDRYGQANIRLSARALDAAQRDKLQALEARSRQRAASPPRIDSLARSDREYEIEEWLYDQGLEDAWEYAPVLVNLGYDRESIRSLAEDFSRQEALDPVLGWLCATYDAYVLLEEIQQGSSRISDIVKALKSYSYLDQAPVQEVDVHEGLDNTLIILRSKLKGIEVKQDYADDLPEIQAYGSELNQVWTNILDNAADALEGEGTIVIRTRQEGDWVVVEIEDDGPGIPEKIREKVFDPFFTTKPPGKGTGLGLNISYNIVVQKHRGDIKVRSQPGRMTEPIVMALFWLFFLSHLIGDYPLQNTWLVEAKRKLWGLALHVGIHLLVLVVLSWEYLGELWPYALLLVACHFGIDAFKNLMAKIRPRWLLGPYLFDQLLHLISIVLVIALIGWAEPSLTIIAAPWRIYAAGYLLATHVWYITEKIIAVGDIHYLKEVQKQFLPRLFVRALLLTVFLGIGGALGGNALWAALVIPYLHGRFRRRALAIDVAVSFVAAALIVLAT